MSNDLNQCQFIGRLGKDPEMRFTASGIAIASFSIACGSSWKDKATGEKQEKTEWVNCAAFGKLAEIVGEYLKKGAQVYVSGRLQTDKVEKDGATKYYTKIIVDRIQMLGKKSDAASPATSCDDETTTGGGARGKIEDFDDDIPFAPLRSFP